MSGQRREMKVEMGTRNAGILVKRRPNTYCTRKEDFECREPYSILGIRERPTVGR